MPKLANSLWFIVNRIKKTLNFQLSIFNLRKSSGFSLIELLTVISIIGILVAAATVSFSNAQMKSRDGKRKTNLKSVQNALELYFQDNGTYPNSDTGRIKCNIGADDDDNPTIDWGGNFTCEDRDGDEMTYLNPLPRNPRGGTFEYFYGSVSSTENVYLKYKISAKLENANDPEYCTSGCIPDPLPCNPEAGRSYCVIQP